MSRYSVRNSYESNINVGSKIIENSPLKYCTRHKSDKKFVIKKQILRDKDSKAMRNSEIREEFIKALNPYKGLDHWSFGFPMSLVYVPDNIISRTGAANLNGVFRCLQDISRLIHVGNFKDAYHHIYKLILSCSYSLSSVALGKIRWEAKENNEILSREEEDARTVSCLREYCEEHSSLMEHRAASNDLYNLKRGRNLKLNDKITFSNCNGQVVMPLYVLDLRNKGLVGQYQKAKEEAYEVLFTIFSADIAFELIKLAQSSDTNSAFSSAMQEGITLGDFINNPTLYISELRDGEESFNEEDFNLGIMNIQKDKLSTIGMIKVLKAGLNNAYKEDYDKCLQIPLNEVEKTLFKDSLKESLHLFHASLMSTPFIVELVHDFIDYNSPNGPFISEEQFQTAFHEINEKLHESGSTLEYDVKDYNNIPSYEEVIDINGFRKDGTDFVGSLYRFKHNDHSSSF